MASSKARRRQRTRRRKDLLSVPPEIPKEWKKDENGDYPKSKVTEISFVSFDAIFDLASVAPFQAAQEANGACTTLKAGYHQHLRSSLSSIYAIAYYLVLNEYELKHFLKLAVWEDKKYRPSTSGGMNHILRFVLQYAFMKTTTSANIISRYYIGLEDLFNKGEKPEAVRDHLMKEGPEKMYQQAKNRSDNAKQQERQKNSFDDLDNVISGEVESSERGYKRHGSAVSVAAGDDLELLPFKLGRMHRSRRPRDSCGTRRV